MIRFDMSTCARGAFGFALVSVFSLSTTSSLAEDFEEEEDDHTEAAPEEKAAEKEAARKEEAARKKAAKREKAARNKAARDAAAGDQKPRQTAQRRSDNEVNRWPTYRTPTRGDATQTRMPFHPSMTVPDGYHLEETPRYAVIAGGVSLTATLWVASTITAISLDREKSQDGDPNFDDMYWPMFIPVVGPFATIATADSSGTGAAILGLDGTIQAIGLAMAIAGFAAPTVELVQDYEVTIGPMASSETGGFSVAGSF